MHKQIAKQLGRLISAVLVMPLLAATTQAAEFECKEPESRVITLRIVGGSTARVADWPFIVGLRRIGNQSSFCGGSLINEEWVLTAGHCDTGQIDLLTSAEIARSAGDGKLQPSGMRIVKKIRHPDYAIDASGAITNDVMLLKLAAPVQISTSQLPILANSRLENKWGFPASCSEVAGWGKTGETAGIASTLQSLHVPVMPFDQCAASYAEVTSGEHLCAGYLAGEKDSCQGDSGGPLIVRAGPTGYMQIGVVSFGEGCARPGKPGVYARVAGYRDWIFETVENN